MSDAPLVTKGLCIALGLALAGCNVTGQQAAAGIKACETHGGSVSHEIVRDAYFIVTCEDGTSITGKTKP